MFLYIVLLEDFSDGSTYVVQKTSGAALLNIKSHGNLTSVENNSTVSDNKQPEPHMVTGDSVYTIPQLRQTKNNTNFKQFKSRTDIK
jgi:capsule polysaccharide modification protein KpsS